MRLYSTSESAEQGEISALAIVETLVAMSLTIWIAVHYQTVVHVAISGCIAPFLLLRTQASTKLALSWFEKHAIADRFFEFLVSPVIRLADGIDSKGIFGKLIAAPVTIAGGFVVLLILGGAATVARMVAVLCTFLREPIGAFRAVAANWRRVAWATDSGCPPEILPGIETSDVKTGIDSARFGRWISEFPRFDWRDPSWYGYVLVVSPIIILTCYVPSLLYRFSLKSTSILYMPFMFVIRSHIGEDLSAKERIHDIKFGATEQLQWYYAWIVLIANSTALLALSANIAVLNNAIESGGPMIALLCDLFLPTNGQQLTLKAWHIARFANAAFVLCLYFYADKAERRLDSGRWTENQVTTTFEIVRQVQLVLALYTTFCALSRFIQFALDAKLPPVGFEFLP